VLITLAVFVFVRNTEDTTMTSQPFLPRFRFTQRTIEQLPAHHVDSRSRFAECSDDDVTGLRMLINRGSG
jgi:hypothetical protein